MPEFYVIFARKIIKMPEFLLYLPEKLTQFPNFFNDIIANNARILHDIITRKIFFSGIFWASAPSLSPTPMFRPMRKKYRPNAG